MHLLIGLGYLAQSQEVFPTDIQLVADTTKQSWLEEVVVTTFGSRSLLMEYPVAVSLITASEIRLHEGKGLPAVLHIAPGVYAHQGTLNTNRITIRGIGARVPYATGRLRSWIDEVPLTNGSGYSMVEYIDPAFASQAEVMRSPTTMAHGGSLGGAIMLRTIPDQPAGTGASLRLSAGSYGQQGLAGLFTTGESKNHHRLLLSAGSAEGWRENNSHSRLFAGYATTLNISNKHQLRSTLIAQKLKSYIPSSIDSATFSNNPHAAATNWKNTKGYEDGNRVLGGLSSIWKFEDELVLKTTLYGHLTHEEELRPFDNFFENRRLGGIKIQVTRPLLLDQTKMEFSAGLEGFVEKVGFVNFRNTDGLGSIGDSISRNKENIRSMAMFLQADASRGRTLLSAGLYVQQLKNTFFNRSVVLNREISDTYLTGTVFSPRLAANHSFDKRFSIFGSFSHGFSPPPLSETLDSEGMLNPDIRPEQSRTIDIGLRMLTPNNTFFAELVFFSMHIRHLLVAERIDADRWIGRNAGKALHRGAEITTVLNLTDFTGTNLLHLKWKNTFAAGLYRFLDFEDRGVNHAGRNIPGIPRITLNSMIELRHQSGISLNLLGEYTGKMAMNDANTRYSTSYTLLHARAAWSAKWKRTGLEFYLQANNLTNARYASMILVNAPGQRNPRYYYPGMPRHIEAGSLIRLGN